MTPIPQTARYLDAHAHLDLYRDGGARALKDIEAHSILTISTAMNPGAYKATCALAESSPLVIPAFGVHPWEAHHFSDRIDELDDDLDGAPLIGEVGLDYRYVTERDRYPAQERVFEYFLSHAEETGKILNLHIPGAEAIAAEKLRARNIARAIVHWYSGPIDALTALIDIGCYFTVGVELLFSEHIRNIAGSIPPRLLLTETDNPVGIMWYQEEIHEGMPPLVRDIVSALTAIHRISPDDLAGQIMENFHMLTKDDPHFTGYFQSASHSESAPA